MHVLKLISDFWILVSLCCDWLNEIFRNGRQKLTNYKWGEGGRTLSTVPSQ
jgi:hypothetical protein